MSTGYHIDQQALHYLTIQVVDWIDVFTRKAYRDIVIDSLQFCQKHKGLQIFGYVIMSNHIHLIANSPQGELSNTVRGFKKFTRWKALMEFFMEKDMYWFLCLIF